MIQCKTQDSYCQHSSTLWSSAIHMTVIADTAALYLMKRLTLSSLCEFWDHTPTLCLSPGFLEYYESGDLCDRILINWSSLHNFSPKVHWILITKSNFLPLARPETRCQGTIINVRQDQECHVSDDVHPPWIITTHDRHSIGTEWVILIANQLLFLLRSAVGKTHHWWRDLFMCDTVHIRRYNVKSHWKVQGRNSTPE